MLPQRFSVLLAEDEPLARRRLVRLIKERHELDLVAVCKDGRHALQALHDSEIDIALIDIEMPGISGMDILHRIAQFSIAPQFILVTAHPQYAIQAFDGEAVDYILKPFAATRLNQALRIASERIRSRHALHLASILHATVDQATRQLTHVDRTATLGHSIGQSCVLVRTEGRLLLLRYDQIDWLEADGHSCLLYCGDIRHRIEGPWRALLERLQQEHFVQLSRSILVNTNRIREIQEMCKGNLVAVLANNRNFAVSRRFRRPVLMRLGAHRV